MKEQYLKAWVNWLDKYRKLNDDEFGKLMRAALHYQRTGEVIELRGRMEVILDGILVDVKRGQEDYEAKCATNAENGKKGGRPRKTNKTEKTQSVFQKANGFSKSEKSQEEDKEKKKKREDILPPKSPQGDVFAEFAKGDAALLDALKAFVEMRKNLKSPMTERAKSMLTHKLEQMAGGNRKQMIAILDQSILHGWKDVYALKQAQGTSSRACGDEYAVSDLGKEAIARLLAEERQGAEREAAYAGQV